MQRHRLFHTLVFSSVMALEGCALSHATDGPPFMPPAAPDAQADVQPDAGTDTAEWPDTSVAPDDAGFDAEADAEADAVADALPDASPDADAEPADAAMDARLCEAGWPPTKATFCVPVDAGPAMLCCRTVGDEECCVMEGT